jgi:hypothetical protein
VPTFLKIRCSDEELTAWTAAAKAEDTNLSAWVRSWLAAGLEAVDADGDSQEVPTGDSAGVVAASGDRGEAAIRSEPVESVQPQHPAPVVPTPVPPVDNQSTYAWPRGGEVPAGGALVAATYVPAEDLKPKVEALAQVPGVTRASALPEKTCPVHGVLEANAGQRYCRTCKNRLVSE